MKNNRNDEIREKKKTQNIQSKFAQKNVFRKAYKTFSVHTPTIYACIRMGYGFRKLGCQFVS